MLPCSRRNYPTENLFPSALTSYVLSRDFPAQLELNTVSIAYIKNKY